MKKNVPALCHTPHERHSVVQGDLSSSVRLILASQSPRRRLLLQQRGIVHEAMHPGVDDALLQPPAGISGAQWAISLAYLKGRAGAELLLRQAREGHAFTPALVIGADTVVVKGRELIGQPRDVADAERIIRALQNGEHEVITGVSIIWCVPQEMQTTTSPAEQLARDLATDAATDPVIDDVGRLRRELFIDRARVRVGNIGEAQIADYLASGMWRGKAGAYNLSERLEAGWPIDYDGDAGTIMGLPVAKLVAILASLGHTF